MTTAVQRLAGWIGTVQYEDLPPRVLDRARWQIMSVIAAVHAGMDTAAGKAVHASLQGRRGGPCTVLPLGERRSLADALLVSGAYSMVLDYDDYLLMGHTGHSAVLGAWAVCEAEGLSTRDLLLAQVIANEIEGRLGASCVLGPQNGQAWSFIHAAGGAALAARLYGLGPERIVHALAIALYQPPFVLWPGFMGPTSKALTAAAPTAAGIQAARLASQGLTGALDILEHPAHGFWRHFSFAPLPGMLAGLGQTWVSDTLAYKQYPGCAYLDTTLDALLDVLAQFERSEGRRLQATEVASIAVEAGALTVGMDNLSSQAAAVAGELSPVAINFSIPYSAAIAVLAGRLTGSELSPGFLDANATAIRDLAAKVTLTHDWTMTGATLAAFDSVFGDRSPLGSLGLADWSRVALGLAPHLRHGQGRRNDLRLGALLREHGRGLLRALRRVLTPGKPADLSQADLSGFRMCFPARVTLQTRSGMTLTARQDVPLGAPGQQHMVQTVERKFRTELGAHMKGTEVEAALEMIHNIEHIELSDLTRAVCSGRGRRRSSGGH